MPELPEVETIRQQLSSILPLPIIKVQEGQYFKSLTSKKKFKFPLTSIESIDRHGKWLIFNLKNKFHLLSHLGMSGTWRISSAPLLKEKHIHLSLQGRSNWLSYQDPRRFGKMYLLSATELQEKLNRQGRDLCSKDFDVKYIKVSCEKYPERLLKVHLLDQHFFAGSGNYIASEVCARAGILPMRKIKTLKEVDYKNIYKAFFSVVNNSLKSQGMTFQGGYKDTQGENGGGLQNLVVFYQKICGLCKKNKVQKVFLAQRGTYFCPSCQK